MTKRYVGYFRVSTKRQGASGLGLEAQQEAVRGFLGDGGRLVAEFVEVESGKSDTNRPQLQAALAACRLHRAVLVIAKLDRLSRDAAFLMGMEKSGIEFICADMPSANRLTVGIMALVAQQEREATSARTKAALAAAKARGVKLGTPGNLRNRETGSARGVASRVAKAAALAEMVMPVIAELRQAGAVTLREIAEGLNARGIPAARGGAWSDVAVMRVRRREQAAA